MRFAAPSCVIPGTVAENARFLAGRVREAALCCFEAAACLAYTGEDLLMHPERLPLGWHLHLPLDLPWEEGGEAAAGLALAVYATMRRFAPKRAVLHPPVGMPVEAAREVLADFAARWRFRGPPLLLENIRGCQLTELGAAFLDGEDLGVCLDVGHLLGYAQDELLASDLPERASLIHWSAPGPEPGLDRHLPLTALTEGQRATALALLPRLCPRATHLVEVFDWPGAEASMRWLEEAEAEAEKAATPAERGGMA